MLDTPYLVREWGLPLAIVLLSGDSHAWVGLDYQGGGSDGDPSVPWLDTELDSELSLASASGTFRRERHGGRLLRPRTIRQEYGPICIVKPRGTWRTRGQCPGLA
ncbi:hypothetical protein CWE27_26710 [Streptomyces sp. EAG2]|nr:hypothetical protein CWE27_26710 [Streptomyces sp. EAG2]